MLCNTFFPLCGKNAVEVVENTPMVSQPSSLLQRQEVDEFVLWDYQRQIEEPEDAEFKCGTHRRMTCLS